MTRSKNVHFITAFFASFLLGACGSGNKTSSEPNTSTSDTELFSAADAASNLQFSRAQYLKMLDVIADGTLVDKAGACAINPSMLCYPRTEEHGKLFIERQKMWTNGFFPGILWMLLQTDEAMPMLSSADKTRLTDAARRYTDGLESESRRDVTHDLGFIIYNSYGQGLLTETLNAEEQHAYNDIIHTARTTLATRYSEEQGVIRSWDWVPNLPTYYLNETGEQKNRILSISDPWQYPVIVDNMMNLEMMLTSDDLAHRNLAYSHAEKTALNHYFYTEDDHEQSRPIAYHVFDYNEKEPGNWQGLGNISAWTRGQGWSFYGFVSVMEFAKDSQDTSATQYDFPVFVNKLYATLKYYMKDKPVPDWDFFASRSDASQIAAATPEGTAKFSRILGLCDFLIDDHILPYTHWSPILFDQDLMSQNSLDFLQTAQPLRGTRFIVEDKVTVCGEEPYKLTGRSIPKDTSAAALIAAGTYRLAQMTDDAALKAEYIRFADLIMAELSDNYRTDKGSKENFELGFVLHSATGNLPNWSEIDTSIIYADYYFIEANMRKLALDN